MPIPMRDLTHDDRKLIEYARQIADANPDGVDGRMYGGINFYDFPVLRAPTRRYQAIGRPHGPPRK